MSQLKHTLSHLTKSQFNVCSGEQVLERRWLIYNAITGLSENAYSSIPTKYLEPNFTSLVNADIENLFNLYDRVFFQNQLTNQVKDKHVTLNFKVSKANSIRTAGTCQKKLKDGKVIYTLCFPESIFLTLFKENKNSIISAGIECKNRLGCLQATFEHELIHLILSLWDFHGKGIYSPHGKLFQRAIFYYFGHTDFRHTYTTGNIDHLKPEEANVGMKVVFSHQKYNKQLVGIIKRVNKRTASITIPGEDGYHRISWSSLQKTDLPLSSPNTIINEVSKPKQTKIAKYPVGTKVKFQNKKGNEIRGTILRANLKTASITVEGMEGYMRVSWGLVNKV